MFSSENTSSYVPPHPPHIPPTLPLTPHLHPPPPPPPHQIFWDGSHWRWRQLKLSFPLCNLNILWNILIILGRNVEQDQKMCRIQEWQLCLSYFWSYHPLLYLKKISCLLCNSNTLWNILMVLGRNVEQDQKMCCIKEWQLCLSYFSYLVISLCYVRHWLSIDFVSAL